MHEALRPTEYQEHEGLIVQACKHYRWSMRQHGLEWDDLLQAGRMGVMRAMQDFDPARGYKFSTYAGYWIRHFIRREAQNHGRTVRVPVETAYQAWKKGKPITNVRVALDKPRGKAGEEIDQGLLDVLGFVADSDTEREVERDRMAARVHAAMQKLTPRERSILRIRIWREDTLEVAGKEHGITRERARQIEEVALDKLRKALIKVPRARGEASARVRTSRVQVTSRAADGDAVIAQPRP